MAVTWAYPDTRREWVVEWLHGELLADPYRWLEDGSSAEVREWQRRQHALTRAVLDARPERARLRERLAQLLDHGALAAPEVRGRRVFYLRRRPGQQQPTLCVAEPGGDGERVLVDPNALDAGGLVSLDWWQPAPDGRRVAFGTSRGGDEWSTLQVLDVEAGRLLPDRIPRARYASVAWEPDGSGFFYTRYPQPGEVPAGEEYYHRHVFYHRLGEDPARDPRVFGPGHDPRTIFTLHLSRDGRRLVVAAWHGWSRSELYWAERGPGVPESRPLATGRDALFRPIWAGDDLWVLTDLGSPRYRLLRAVPGEPPERWPELLPQHPQHVLVDVRAVAGGLVASWLEDAAARLTVHDRAGRLRGEVPLPGWCTVSALAAEADGDLCAVALESFTAPPSLYLLDLASLRLRPWREAEATFDPAGVRVEQVFYASRDGTRVPMFVLAGARAPRPAPAVLTGYGGFNVSRTPAYAAAAAAWLEGGGVYAVANLRGGGEYGEEWHRAGMGRHKQNVFDDFIAAAEWLLAHGVTARDRLGIHGRSNGGLLVAAALTQRPDLFRAVACGVPLVDMLRYHRFLLGALWIAEYGSPDDPEAFRWLRAYSPYQRIVPGVRYPATLVYTATADTRVDPMHARKLAAALQQASASGWPVLLRVEEEAGHGAGKPVARVVEEQADIWAFLAWQLGWPAA